MFYEPDNDIRKMYVVILPNEWSDRIHPSAWQRPSLAPSRKIMRSRLTKEEVRYRALEALIKPLIANAEAAGSQNQKASKTSKAATGVGPNRSEAGSTFSILDRNPIIRVRVCGWSIRSRQK